MHLSYCGSTVVGSRNVDSFTNCSMHFQEMIIPLGFMAKALCGMPRKFVKVLARRTFTGNIGQPPL